ncbi:RNase H-like domain found in reverse transcriptase [Popillia japonica]|uniref:RNase H-like domain found in reverse transcriptase n=1 Tax=Popillia japonica TaxID=7064 RepID=A0AAW1LS71_POPJA
MQEGKDGSREIVAFPSRLLSDVEKRYAQIEKEALAITWAAEYFSEYITGVTTLIFETDHKPLIQILMSKNLDDLTPRLQRFRMRLMRYRYDVIYTPEKKLVVPDTLSRSPLENSFPKYDELRSEVDSYVNTIVKYLPVKDHFLKEIMDNQVKDPIIQKLKEYSLTDWPDRSQLPIELLPYYPIRAFGDSKMSRSRKVECLVVRVIIANREPSAELPFMRRKPYKQKRNVFERNVFER